MPSSSKVYFKSYDFLKIKSWCLGPDLAVFRVEVGSVKVLSEKFGAIKS